MKGYSTGRLAVVEQGRHQGASHLGKTTVFGPFLDPGVDFIHHLGDKGHFGGQVQGLRL